MDAFVPRVELFDALVELTNFFLARSTEFLLAGLANIFGKQQVIFGQNVADINLTT